jgi:aquaglyceroporin related protein
MGQNTVSIFAPILLLFNHVDAYPREAIREPAAEMLGTMILILVGTGVNCQFALSADVNISPSPKGSYLGFNVAWGCGL